MTTSYRPDAATIERAKVLASELGAKFVARRQSSIPRLRRTYGPHDVLTVSGDGLRFLPVSGNELFFHPSMAAIRVKRLLNGEPDILMDLAGVKPGDQVIDCTAGLGSDAIVFAHAAGPDGEVAAVEASRILYTLLREGLRDYEPDTPELKEAFGRVRPVYADHLDYLRGLADKSCDVVYFDPMFRIPVEASDAISPLRRLADPSPVRPEAVAEAVRVARRAVVLKEHRDSGEFAQLGFAKTARAHSKIAYGVIRP